jgi:signal transduction histidine kinase
VSLRLAILVTNFLVYPNSNWREIDNLRHAAFLGEQVSMPGDIVVRWQWLSTASLFLMMVYVTDACWKRLRQAQPDSQRRVLTIVFALAVPMIAVIPWTQIALLGVAHIPVVASPWFLFTLSAIAFEFSRELVTITRARRELVELRGEVAHLSRVTALGQLAPALAHELAQPLAAVRVDIETAKICLQAKDPSLSQLRTLVADIDESDARAAEILERMQALIKRHAIAMQPLALDEVVKEVISLVHSEAVTRRVAIDCILQPDLPLVAGDRVQVSQVLLNLLINAMDAVQSCSVDAKRIVIEARAVPSGTIEVAVRDSGPGIPHECIEKVFTPFFTTKAAGTGMGLAVSRTIVEAHGGHIWAERSAEGTGATFRFSLQRAWAAQGGSAATIPACDGR